MRTNLFSLLFTLAVWAVPNPTLAESNQTATGTSQAFASASGWANQNPNLGASSATGFATTTAPVPEGANLGRYPIVRGRLSAAWQAELGLKPMKLMAPLDVYNYFNRLPHGRSGWVLDRLAVGTVVLVDASGTPIYKEECGNRLVLVTARGKCPACPVIPAGGAADPGFWARHPGFRDILEGLGLFLLFLLGVLLLMLLARAIGDLVGEMTRKRGGAQFHPGPTTTTAPAPVAAPADAKTTPPASDRKWFSYYRDEFGEHKYKFGGHKEFHASHENDVTTIRHR